MRNSPDRQLILGTAGILLHNSEDTEYHNSQCTRCNITQQNVKILKQNNYSCASRKTCFLLK